MALALNRTNVELKLSRIVISVIGVDSITLNRTNVELKHDVQAYAIDT